MWMMALDSWRIQSLLGRGAHGATYLALAPDGAQVALKLVPTGGDATMVSELRALGESSRRVGHPQVMAWQDVLDGSDRAGLVMEHAPGGSLGDVVGGAPRLSPATLLRWAVAASRGLAAAHAHGLLHGDLKPTAFLIGRTGEPIISDFGLSRVVLGAPADDRVVGSVEYVDPAASRGAALDERSDVYAFAVVLFEALCWMRAPGAGSRQVRSRRSQWRITARAIAAGRARRRGRGDRQGERPRPRPSAGQRDRTGGLARRRPRRPHSRVQHGATDGRAGGSRGRILRHGRARRDTCPAGLVPANLQRCGRGGSGCRCLWSAPATSSRPLPAGPSGPTGPPR
jgi:Protein kinase domain